MSDPIDRSMCRLDRWCGKAEDVVARWPVSECFVPQRGSLVLFVPSTILTLLLWFRRQEVADKSGLLLVPLSPTIDNAEGQLSNV